MDVYDILLLISVVKAFLKHACLNNENKLLKMLGSHFYIHIEKIFCVINIKHVWQSSWLAVYVKNLNNTIFLDTVDVILNLKPLSSKPNN